MNECGGAHQSNVRSRRSRRSRRRRQNRHWRSRGRKWSGVHKRNCQRRGRRSASRSSRSFKQRWSERYTTLSPVNQRIVAGEPVVSKYQRARGVQPSDVEVQSHAFTSGEQNRQVHSASDEGVGRAIKKSEVDRRNGGGRQVIVLDQSGINK